VANQETNDNDEEEAGSAPPPSVARSSFILTLWVERAGEEQIWRGSIETASRERTYFRTLRRLTEYLISVTGWREPTK